MNGEKVAGIRDTKYLGVTLNSKLTWDTHISKISSEANRMLGLLRRNLKYSPKHIKEAAYKSYVRPKTRLEVLCHYMGTPEKKTPPSRLKWSNTRQPDSPQPQIFLTTGTQSHRQANANTIKFPTSQNFDGKLWLIVGEKNRLTFLYRIINALVDVSQNYHPQ